ncbi:MAG: protease PrsW [Pseudonocardiales bacterium]|jgi:RsiW-degrading membrane proteinase PrsW (M82 family)|nr:protease PrsW [Pseudonocardiales bacterium]
MPRTGHRLPAPAILFPWRAWLAHPLLRAWTTWLFVALVTVPPLALTLLPDRSTDIATPATVFAFYFAAAWFLVLWVVVRPQKVPTQLLAPLVALALVIEVPLAVALEQALDANPGNPLVGIVTIGFPEELAKILPVAVLALTRRQLFASLGPRDVLFLGAVSGLVFGAVEAVHYAATAMDVSSTADGLVLVWRLVSDPIMHACWAGVAGYFLGLATRYTEPGPWTALAGLGIGVPAILHGLNDWVASDLNLAWVLITIVSTLFFLAYARIGIAAAPPRQSWPASPATDPPTMPIPIATPAPGPGAPHHRHHPATLTKP